MRSKLFILAALISVISCAVGTPAAADTQSQPRLLTCTWIKTANQLQAMRNNVAATYCLANDIDAGTIANFVPIGTSNNRFTGKLFGNNHVITNLTINSAKEYVGLFGIVDDGALIRDVALVNANIVGTKPNCSGIGALMGSGQPNTVISRVRVSGSVRGRTCAIGGIAGSVSDHSSITESWSTARVTGANFARTGGAVGILEGSGTTMTRTYATGVVSCGDNCKAGGLAGQLINGPTLDLSFAAGPATVGASTEGTSISAAAAGGLIGYQEGIKTVTRRSFALGPVAGGTGAYVGGLIGQNATTLTESYAIGLVTGDSGFTGGLIGQILGSPIVMDSYWDTQTSGQGTSAGGLGGQLMTSAFRADLPPGFSNAWAITKTLSYPFLNDPDIDFASPLATLVRASTVFVFLPISQLDVAQYATAPMYADEASLAAVYTMIARGVGVAHNDARLSNARIDRFFWNDATQTTMWRGPVTTYVTLGPLTNLPAATPLNSTNVIGLIDAQRPVILRGRYRKSDNSVGTHWLLGTLYTTRNNGGVNTVVAHDPATGAQIEIDPDSKRVLTPGFPLTNFRVRAYQAATVN